jgi:hypothetical protein
MSADQASAAEQSADDVDIRGAATPDEIAAVLSALRMRELRLTPHRRYEQWRRERIRALRDNR